MVGGVAVTQRRASSPVMKAAVIALLSLIVAPPSPVRGDFYDVVSDVGLDDPLNYFWNTRNTLINTVDEQCMSAGPNGVIQGSCKNNFDCRFSGGVTYGRGSCNFLSTCCIFQRSCGRTTRAKYSSFVSPQGISNLPQTCTYQVQIINPNICQVRIDIETSLAEPGSYPRIEDPTMDPNSGECIYDYIQIVGYPENRIPRICGVNLRQHIYVPVTPSQRTVDINVVISDRLTTNAVLPPPYWKLEVTQLECPGRQGLLTHGNKSQAAADFSRLAPDNCLQYFTEPTGEIKSFNYDGQRGFMNRHDYAICFKRAPSSCGVRFQPGEFNLGSDCALDYLYIPENIDGLAIPEALAEEYQCMEQVAPFSWNSQHPGPLYVHFHTDATLAEGKGFNLKYSMLNNC